MIAGSTSSADLHLLRLCDFPDSGCSQWSKRDPTFDLNNQKTRFPHLRRRRPQRQSRSIIPSVTRHNCLCLSGRGTIGSPTSLVATAAMSLAGFQHIDLGNSQISNVGQILNWNYYGASASAVRQAS
jgi:hypothetical protein